MTTNYDDIIHLPRPRSRHPKMPADKRAAQFVPFAALTGYDDSIDEAARLTEPKPLLSNEERTEIEMTIRDAYENNARVRLTVFIPDGLKAGGSFEEIVEKIDRIDEYTATVVLQDKRRIAFTDIVKARADE